MANMNRVEKARVLMMLALFALTFVFWVYYAIAHPPKALFGYVYVVPFLLFAVRSVATYSSQLRSKPKQFVSTDYVLLFVTYIAIGEPLDSPRMGRYAALLAGFLVISLCFDRLIAQAKSREMAQAGEVNETSPA
ncbi:MAG: hypothetical protein GC165_00865 [Armatimonadetes bacterium]|nr:hypothetical protein [Armatimonadota bacterium]